MRFLVFIVLICLTAKNAFAQTLDSTISINQQNFNTIVDKQYFERKPGLISHLSKIPNNIVFLAKSPFRKKNWMVLGGIAATTLLLVPQDQQITDWVKKTSANINLDPETRYKDLIKFGKTRILKVPLNLNSALYQMGEGGTTIMIASGLWISGKINNNYRDIQTAYDLTETFASSGIISQVFKRISGRESPFKATVPAGKWNPFPSFATYQKNTSSHDAFPSGHLTTLTATFTVLHYNYPEKKWITPLGLGIMSLSLWAMVNTEVHWLSDYPLAIACGYITGKITAMRHYEKKINKIVNPISQ